MKKFLRATAMVMVFLIISTQSAFACGREKETFKVRDKIIEAEVYNTDKTETLVLLHGAGERDNIFHDLIDELGTDFRIVNIELPNVQFKRAGIEPNMDVYASYVEDYITAICDKYQIEKVHYAGHSLGGLLGFKMGERGFDKIKSFTSLAGAPNTDYITEQYVKDATSNPVTSMKLIYRETTQDFKLTTHFLHWFNPTVFAYDFRYAIGYDVDISNIEFPVLIVHGSKDQVVRYDKVKNLPYPKLVLPTGHLLIVEDDYTHIIAEKMVDFIYNNR